MSHGGDASRKLAWRVSWGGGCRTDEAEYWEAGLGSGCYPETGKGVMVIGLEMGRHQTRDL